jgi:leucine-rich PPR motif-containing protein
MGLTPNAKSLSPVIDGLCKIGEVDKAVDLINDMDKEGCSLDKMIYETVMKVICKTKQLSGAFRLMDSMEKHGWSLHVTLVKDALQFFIQEKKVDLKPLGVF